MIYTRKFSLFFLSILVFVGCSKTPQEKPNIIWLMAEDISNDLECYGMKAVKTPTLNKLAEDGILFTNTFSTNPICGPNRSAMLTGVHQVKMNAHNHRSNKNVTLTDPIKPVTYWLKEAGYTNIYGYHGVMSKGQKIDVNFKTEPLGTWDGKTNFGLFDKTDYFDEKDQPFFAHIQLKATHRGNWWDRIRAKSQHPVNPDSVKLPPYLADHPTIRLDWAKYLDQIEYMDDEVAMILKELEEKGLAENTIIIFVGDNGRCNIRGKGYLHDSGLRVPLIVKLPNGLNAGEVRDDVISTTDITATVLDLAGVKIPKYMTGQSFFAKDFNREEVYSARDLWDEVDEKSRSISTKEWKYIRNDKPEIPFDAHQAYLEFFRPAVHIMRKLNKENKLNTNQKFFFADKKPKEELYNLKDDPFELVNLVGNSDYNSILEKMRNKTSKYDEKMKPVSDVYIPVHPESVDVIKWVKKAKPELYKKMLNGSELDFAGLAKEFKELNSK
ncbi:MAG: sulfatase [Melioribacteraceae bacterium]